VVVCSSVIWWEFSWRIHSPFLNTGHGHALLSDWETETGVNGTGMGDFCTLWAFSCEWFGMFLQMQFTTCNIYVVSKFLLACPFRLCQCIAASRTSLGPNLGKWGIAYPVWSSDLLAGKVEFNSTVDLLQATWQAWPLLRWYWSTVSYLCWCFSRANCQMDTEILFCTQGFVVLRLWVSEGCLWRKWKVLWRSCL